MKKQVFLPICLLVLLAGTVTANNLPPLASFTNDVNRDFFFAGESVTFDGSGSIDQDEGGLSITRYRWKIDGVTMQENSSSLFTTTFSLSGGQSSKTVQVTLEVRDDENTWTTHEDKMTKTYTIRRGQDRHFYLKDHLGSVRVTVDEEGEPLGFDDYYPYGLQMPTRSSNTANPNDRYKFTGHERDTEAGLTFDYMGARTYDPLLGIFMQIDPLMEFSTPYSYVGANPVNLTDPTGMSSECANRGHRGIEDLEAYLVECGSQTALTQKVDPQKEKSKEIEREEEKKEGDIELDQNCPKCKNKGDQTSQRRRPKSQRGKILDMFGEKTKQYNGKGLGGTNYIGPGPNVNPIDLLSEGLIYVDEIDMAAFEHDIAYFMAGTGGAIGAFLNLDVLDADIALVAKARDIMERYNNGVNPDVDAVTGDTISQRTYFIAEYVNAFFTPIIVNKIAMKYF